MRPTAIAWGLIILAVVFLTGAVVGEEPDRSVALFTCALVVAAGFGVAQVMRGMFRTWTRKERQARPVTWAAAIVAPVALGLTALAVVWTDDPALGRQALGYAGLYIGWIAGDLFRRDREA